MKNSRTEGVASTGQLFELGGRIEGFVIEGPGLPEWLRTTFRDDRGEAYLPCGAFDDERMVFLCVAHDGVPVVRSEGHIYAPASWLAKEYPKYALVARVMATRTLAA